MNRHEADVLIMGEHPLDRSRTAALLPAGSYLCADCLCGLRHPGRPRAVVVIGKSCQSGFVEKAMEACRRSSLESSSVLVTEFDRENVRALMKEWNGEVVWLDRLEVDLEAVVGRILAQGPCRRLHDWFASGLPEVCAPLGSSIHAAFLEEPPALCLEDLAAVGGVSVTALLEFWRQSGFPGRVEALLDWALMARIVQLRGRGLNLNRSCAVLGTEPYRIQRAAFRRAGTSAGSLDEAVLWDTVNAWRQGG